MILNRQDYRNKVMGCWMGKNIGGTIGAPFEWRRQVNDVSFYTQDLGGEPLPNDDLDIQLLWLVALEERGIDLDAHQLAEYWVLYVTPHWSEYGTAKINMRSGLVPPLSGTYMNDFKDSCGAFIRSEIWACIAPGAPHIAARYAYEDAILDHGNGEGTYAEVFCAAMESAAFVVDDINTLVDIGLSYIPADCGVAGAVKCAMESYRSGKTWLEARDALLEGYRGMTMFGNPWATSEEDRKKGFDKGKLGWDVPSNIGILLIGLLYGEGDFAKSLCIGVNCGEDTDCTAATIGSIFGIMKGIDSIPEKWIAPIGRKIKTACLNLGELGYFGNQLPSDIDNLTDRTMGIARQVSMRNHSSLRVADGATDLSGLNVEALKGFGLQKRLYWNMNGPVFKHAEFDIAVDYGEEGPVVKPGSPKRIIVKINNKSKTQANMTLRWYLPEGIKANPEGGNIMCFPPHFHRPLEMEFTLEPTVLNPGMNRGVIEISLAGRPSAILVPITLLNGSLA